MSKKEYTNEELVEIAHKKEITEDEGKALDRATISMLVKQMERATFIHEELLRRAVITAAKIERLEEEVQKLAFKQ